VALQAGGHRFDPGTLHFVIEDPVSGWRLAGFRVLEGSDRLSQKT
jgi:hypothetical protein